MNEIVKLRELPGAEVLDFLSCSYITERFFHRSRAWFIQRLNNNLVNGKPASFSPDELLKLRNALQTLASEITEFSTQIPHLPTDMSIKVYVVTEPTLIDFLVNNDLDGFTAYLNESKEEDYFITFDAPKSFATEPEAIAFCIGLGYDTDDHATPARYPLRSSEPTDLPFIQAIENY